MVRVVPTDISGLLLGAGGRRGGLPICLIKEAVIGFFSRQDGVVLDAGLIDLADDRVPEGSASDLHWAHDACRLLDRVGSSRVCTHISGHAALGGSDAKLRSLLSSWDMSVFDFHGEGSGEECYGGIGQRSSDGRPSLRNGRPSLRNE